MRFWDTSAIVPLLIEEQQSARMDALRAEERAMVVWWGTVVECTSAIERTGRHRKLDASILQSAVTRMRAMARSWIEVLAGSQVRDQALRLVRIHPLRAADALQLAAALVAADFHPTDLEFVTLDARQAEAADREGFQVLG